MRYYVYVSEAKLDMLFGQIPPKLLSRLGAEVKVDLKVVGLTVQKDRTEADTYGRLEVVEAYLDRNFDISWMNEPSTWFRGESDLRMSGYGRAPDGPVFMMGQEGGTVVVLIGSAHHLIGQRVSPDTAAVGHSMLPSLFRLVQQAVDDRLLTAPGGVPRRESPAETEEMLQQVVQLGRGLRGPGSSCEFLARRLLSGVVTDGQGRQLNVVVGTPLYVALLGE
ncbi:DUF7019 family protein [Streptomyces sp. SYSU K21746]